MSDTRRDLLHSAVSFAAGTVALPAQQPGQAPPTGRGAATEVQVPKVKFGETDISRLVCGCNPFYGFSHFNRTTWTP